MRFLRMIIAFHELAHLREKNHDKAFYQLCSYMEPQYHQLRVRPAPVPHTRGAWVPNWPGAMSLFEIVG